MDTIHLLTYFVLLSGGLFTCCFGNPCFMWPTARYFNGFCYKLSDVTSNWTDAQRICTRELVSARLAEPRLDSSLAFLIKILTLTGEDWWIGGIINSSIGRWASTNESITSGNVTFTGTGQCIQMSDTRLDWLLPLMTDGSCSASKKFVCEFRPGNPCVDKFNGADYFGGFCYKQYTNVVYWDGAIAKCKEEKAILAEFYDADTYYSVKNYIQLLVAKQVFIAPNSRLFLEDSGVTLGDSGNFEFLIRTCRDLKVYLWSDANTTAALRSFSTSTLNPYSVPQGDYYVIDYGMVNLKNATLKSCSHQNCELLSSSISIPNFQCNRFLKLSISWSRQKNDIWVSESNLYMNFSYIGYQVMTINRMAIVTGSSSAVWQLKDPLYGTNIYLGGSDMNHEGYFTWLSTDTPINISDWFPGEPNDFTEAKGEDSMSWAVYVTEQIFLQLNDFNGTTVLGRPLCQKDALNVTYLIPLLETEMTSSKSAELQVTSVVSDVTYLKLQQNLTNGSASVRYDWVTSYRAAVIPMNVEAEMNDTGFYKGVVVLTSTRHVTVVLFQKSNNQTGTTLVYPLLNFATSYFVLTPGSPSTGSHICISAMLNNTEIIIRYPRDQTVPVSVTYSGMTFQQIQLTKLTLGSLVSLQLQSPEDLSGTLVYANKPVVVYSGNRIQSSITSYASDVTLDMVLSVDSLSYNYITVPFPGNSTLKLVALYDDTNITIYGPIVRIYRLARAGDVSVVALESIGFHYLKSDVYHPFYAVSLSSGFLGSCLTSLTPGSLWTKLYSVYVKSDQQAVFVVMERNSTSKFIVDNTYVSAELCSLIADSALTGCTLHLNSGQHTLGFNETDGRSSAYMWHSSNAKSSFCHSLSTAESPKDMQVKFPALQYIELNDTATFLSPLIPNLTTTTSWTTSATTNSEGTTSQNASNTPTVQTTLQTITTPSSTAPWETEAQTTTAGVTPSTTTATVAQSVSTSPTAVENNSSVPPSSCVVRQAKNLSQEDIMALISSIHQELLLDKNGIFAYRQKSISIWENRPSCHAVGVSGIALVTSCFAFLFFSDAIRLVQFVHNIWSNKSSHSTNRTNLVRKQSRIQ
nr:hypothetical protein BgiMline_027816 [Biomphalaria glabrata]